MFTFNLYNLYFEPFIIIKENTLTKISIGNPYHTDFLRMGLRTFLQISLATHFLSSITVSTAYLQIYSCAYNHFQLSVAKHVTQEQILCYYPLLINIYKCVIFFGLGDSSSSLKTSTTNPSLSGLNP